MEEEDQFFDEIHENEIKERLTPRIYRILPYNFIDVSKFTVT